jgi:hypothetical protein
MIKTASVLIIKSPAALTIYCNRLKLQTCEVMHAFPFIRSKVKLMVKFLDLYVVFHRKQFKSCAVCRVERRKH